VPIVEEVPRYEDDVRVEAPSGIRHRALATADISKSDVGEEQKP
jgi:hypothetical protein